MVPSKTKAMRTPYPIGLPLRNKAHNMLPSRLKKMGRDFLLKIQRVHDGSEYWDDDGVCRGAKTYLCISISGEAQPGYEPEPEAASHYAIVEVKWVDLRDENTWGKKITSDHLTFPLLKKIQAQLALGKK